MTCLSLSLIAALTVITLSPAEARDGCGRGWFWNGRACAQEEAGPRYYNDAPVYAPERNYYRRDPRPIVGVDPRTGIPTRDVNTAAGCPRYWSLQDGRCKPYTGR